jgi:hypothetical protein
MIDDFHDGDRIEKGVEQGFAKICQIRHPWQQVIALKVGFIELLCKTTAKTSEKLLQLLPSYGKG